MDAHPCYANLNRYLAVINGQTYISPSFVALGIRKIYPHRVIIARPETERSVQYGSQLSAVSALIQGYTPGQVIEEVLDLVEIPI